MIDNTIFMDALENMRAMARGVALRPIPVHVSLGMAELAKRQVMSGTVNAELPAMMAGISAYQAHPFRRAAAPVETVWERGQVKLYRYPAKGRSGGGIFITPSMINRSVILDLLPEKSFTRWLAGRGFDVFLLDWGVPIKDDGMKTMDGVIVERLLPAMEFAAGEADGKIHALGYCMGGTLLAAGAVLCPEALHSTTFLASPWDFHAGDAALARYIQDGTAAAQVMMDQSGILPAEWIQSVFASINAERTVSKFAGFAARAQDDDAARLFVAVEDWLNEGIDLPAGVARTCLHDWYGENAPGQGVWAVDGVKVDLSALDVPALVVASAQDRLVPAESSLAMAKILPRVETFTPEIGHIGMMSGRKSKTVVWEKVAGWLSGLP